MSDEEIAALKKLGQDIRYWKKFAFSGFGTGVLNLDAAIKSLDGPDPCVYARQDYPARWLICKVGSRHRALFHTAAVWASSSHLDTGNYVPEGQTAPTNLPESQIQRIPSNRCQIDYIIDTRYDKILFSHQAAFEKLVTKEKDFNKGGKPRRSWQKGDDGYDSTFTFSAQVFVRPYGQDESKLNNPPYSLHPWVRDVVRPKLGKQDYFANPLRPQLWDCKTGTMVRMDNADPPYLQKGDIVWISFYVEFIIGAHTWSTQLTPRHLIRVGTMPRILMDASGWVEGSQEEEPDYTIEEGATFLLNTDFPMDDETPDVVGTANRVTAPGNHTSDGINGVAEDEVQHNSPQDASCPTIIMSSPDVKEATVSPVVGSEHPHLDEDRKSAVSIHTGQMDEGGGFPTPVSITPGPAMTSADPEWIPSSKFTMSANEDTTRGLKREGNSEDMETSVPTKKPRQTGVRRARNV